MISYQKVKEHLYRRLVNHIFVSYWRDEGITTATHTDTGPVRLVRLSTSLPPSVIRVSKPRLWDCVTWVVWNTLHSLALRYRSSDRCR